MKLQSAEKLIPSVEASTTETPMSEEDAMSVTAPHHPFLGEVEEIFAELLSQVTLNDYEDIGGGSTEGSHSEQEVVKRALQAALVRLGLDAAPVVTIPTNAFSELQFNLILLLCHQQDNYID